MIPKTTLKALALLFVAAFILTPTGMALYANASAYAGCSYSGSITKGKTTFYASAGGSTTDIVGGTWSASGSSTLGGADSSSGTYPTMAVSASSQNNNWVVIADGTRISAESDASARSLAGGSVSDDADDSATCKNPNPPTRSNLCEVVEGTESMSLSIINLCDLLDIGSPSDN